MSLQRKLNSRQLSMIAIGGSIGTGLFLASGSAIHSAGIWGALLGYLIIGAMVYFVMTSLGEMSAYRPVAGSFCEYSSRYVSPSFGFAMSVNYWFNWAITLAAEISAGTIILQYWFPHASTILVGSIILLLILLLNLFSVRGFGETEYWLSMIKVVMVVIFIAIGFMMMAGAFGHHDNQLFTHENHLSIFKSHSWVLIFNVMLIAGFSFQGCELIGVAAGESENPGKDIPKATRLIFWRILLFYILTIFVIGALIPASNPHLVGASNNDVTYSPFTMVMKMAHIHSAASIINFVILSAVFSAANSGAYASSRTLYQLGTTNGGIFKIFSKTTKNGVPLLALLVTLGVGTLAFLSSIWGNTFLYTVLIAASALSGFIAWLGIAISHLYFRRAFKKEGRVLSELPYQSKLYPYGVWFALILCSIVMFGQDTSLFSHAKVIWSELMLTYSSLILFVLIWAGYAIYNRLLSYLAHAPS